MTKLTTDQEFIAALERFKSPAQAARYLGVSERGIYSRRIAVEGRYGIRLDTKDPNIERRRLPQIAPRMELTIENGSVVIFSDAHFWPKIRTTAYEALLALIHKLKPVAVCANGDVIDGATTSRHHRQNWEEQPTLADEVIAAQLCMDAIRKAAKGAKLLFTYGNHDNRLDGWLANKAPEVEGLPGTKLSDYFKDWQMAMGFHINTGEHSHTAIKHRWKGGKHADAANVLNSGVNFATGHDHMLSVFGWSDYTGRKWGMRTGQLSEPYGPQFGYAEDNPRGHCSGFGVMTYKGGELLPPELCEVVNGKAYFRGEQVL